MAESPKTHLTAAVLIPPEPLWEPIQAIRRVHDPQIRRWMPHITLLYPFVPEACFDEAADRLAGVCRTLAPVPIVLREFRLFAHGSRSATLWLAPDPPQAICQLHAALLRAFPDCDDTARFESGYTPHLSVGKFTGEAAARCAAQKLGRTWRPLAWTADAVQLIARSAADDDPFRVRRVLGLGEATPR